MSYSLGTAATGVHTDLAFGPGGRRSVTISLWNATTKPWYLFRGSYGPLNHCAYVADVVQSQVQEWIKARGSVTNDDVERIFRGADATLRIMVSKDQI